MLSPIRLNYQSVLVADEIGNKSANLFLTPELQAMKLLSPQVSPEQLFCICRLFAQFSRGFGKVQVHRRFTLSPSHPPPAPSHKGRGFF
jgi:hypothetical protein